MAILGNGFIIIISFPTRRCYRADFEPERETSIVIPQEVKRAALESIIVRVLAAH